MKIRLDSLDRPDPGPPVDFAYSLTKAELLSASEGSGAGMITSMTVRGTAEKTALVALRYNIAAAFTPSCARCGRELSEASELSGEVFISFEDGGFGEEEGFYTVSGGCIDPAEFAAEFFELSLPIRYLCDEECRGLCPECGADLNAVDCGCRKTKGHPAFAVLDKLKNDN